MNMEYEAVKAEFKKHAGETPLLYTWAMILLQEIEDNIAIAFILDKQIKVVEDKGIGYLDPDLFNDNFQPKLEKLRQKKGQGKMIDNVTSKFGPEGTKRIIEVIKKHEFKYFPKEAITDFSSIFYQCRKVRNRLAHSFFTDNIRWSDSYSEFSSLSNELEPILNDINYLKWYSTIFVEAFSEGLKDIIVQETEEQEANKPFEENAE